MKIYLPGYYLRSLRNQNLVEINAEEVDSTIQVHQSEVQKTRTNRNLKAFEELSLNRPSKDLNNKLIKHVPGEVPPLVQEFIRDSSDDSTLIPPEPSNFSLSQTLNEVQSIQEQDYGVQEFISNHNTSSKTNFPMEWQNFQQLHIPHSSGFSACATTQTVYHPSMFSASESSFPRIFKAKLKKNLRDSILKTPNVRTVRITSLSYSQPSTPKTPMFKSLLCGTPRLQKSLNICTPSLGQYVPFTPMLHEAVKLLDCIPERSEENIDLLNIIDDDTKPVELVDKELDLYSEVNDANVADYVLNIVNDYPVQKEMNVFQKVPKIEINERRKCQRAKPVFLEESEAYKEQKRQKDRDRRKKRKIQFENKSPLGTRRSKRKLRPPPRL